MMDGDHDGEEMSVQVHVVDEIQRLSSLHSFLLHIGAYVKPLVAYSHELSLLVSNSLT